MCEECGCGEAPSHDHAGGAPGHAPERRTVTVARRVLARNDEAAEHNRRWLAARGAVAVNLISSPGAGKTTLLERTLPALAERGVAAAVLVGDVQTDRDAQRLAGLGAPVRQIQTGGACHLDAEQVGALLSDVVTDGVRLLFLENVGNLVCPAAFDLGERHKVALLSVTEGEDKPWKYPALFHRAAVTLITKTDLLPHLEWDRAACHEAVRHVRPDATILALSARSGDGMPAWLDLLVDLVAS